MIKIDWGHEMSLAQKEYVLNDQDTAQVFE